MQSTETDKKTNGDEEFIHFRPSPNFKHMKKYLKSKLEECNQNEVSECNDNKVNMSGAANKALEVNEEKKVKAMIQPPLPPNPPPPDSPPLVTPKQEIENDGYEDVASSSESQSDELTSECKTNDEASVKPEEVMCRNFIRGTCAKRDCRFTHKLILSQLPGIYTFCKNFQNSVCSRLKCKFVHATVFEKEHFLRTGYLPPHVFKHLKETPTTQPPLPQEGNQVFKIPQVPAAFTRPPPPTQLHVTPLTTLQPYPNNVTDRNGTDIIRPAVPGNTSPKRKWSTDEPSRSPCDSDATVPLAKKCKTCDSTEFRYQYNKNKVEKLKQSTLELNQEILQLNKKQQRLNTVLIKLFESMTSSKSSINVLQSSLDMTGDKDEDRLEQFNFNNSRLGEDSNKNNSLTDILMTLLLNSGDTNIPTDSI